MILEPALTLTISTRENLGLDFFSCNCGFAQYLCIFDSVQHLVCKPSLFRVVENVNESPNSAAFLIETTYL